MGGYGNGSEGRVVGGDRGECDCLDRSSSYALNYLVSCFLWIPHQLSCNPECIAVIVDMT